MTALWNSFLQISGMWGKTYSNFFRCTRPLNLYSIAYFSNFSAFNQQVLSDCYLELPEFVLCISSAKNYLMKKSHFLAQFFWQLRDYSFLLVCSVSMIS